MKYPEHGPPGWEPATDGEGFPGYSPPWDSDWVFTRHQAWDVYRWCQETGEQRTPTLEELDR